MTMKGRKLALLLLLVVALEILFFVGTDASPWWRRRRRRSGCSSSRPSSPRWVNNWQKGFNVRCRTSYSIKIWQSRHKNCKGDRIHYFKCQFGPFATLRERCSIHSANDYDRPLAFKCENNGVIAGVKSTYSVGHKDRRFSFRCCRNHGVIAHTCKHTVITNNWNKPMRYVVPRGFYLVGAFSEHDNGKQDRIWKFEICKFNRVRWH